MTKISLTKILLLFGIFYLFNSVVLAEEVSKAEVLREIRNYEKLITTLTKDINSNPDNWKNYINRADSKAIIGGYLKYYLNNDEDALNYYNEAIKDYNTAIKINPNMFINYLSRGRTKENLKDYDGAINDYFTFILIKPNHLLVKDTIDKIKTLMQN